MRGAAITRTASGSLASSRRLRLAGGRQKVLRHLAVAAACRSTGASLTCEASGGTARVAPPGGSRHRGMTLAGGARKSNVESQRCRTKRVTGMMGRVGATRLSKSGSRRGSTRPARTPTMVPATAPPPTHRAASGPPADHLGAGDVQHGEGAEEPRHGSRDGQLGDARADALRCLSGVPGDAPDLVGGKAAASSISTARRAWSSDSKMPTSVWLRARSIRSVATCGLGWPRAACHIWHAPSYWADPVGSYGRAAPDAVSSVRTGRNEMEGV